MVYTHAGNGRLVRTGSIIGIFDMDTSTHSSSAKRFLEICQDEGRLIVTTSDVPRSFIVTEDEMVTLSLISPKTMAERIKRGDT